MKAQSVQLIGTVLLGMAVAACTPQEKPLPKDLITALQTRYNEADPEGAAALFTNDGAIMTEFGETVTGKEEIAKFMRQELDKKLQYWVKSEGTETSGRTAYDYGTIRIRDTARGIDIENMKYLTMFRKEGGSWKIARTIYNTNSLSACTTVQIIPADASVEAPSS